MGRRSFFFPDSFSVISSEIKTRNPTVETIEGTAKQNTSPRSETFRFRNDIVVQQRTGESKALMRRTAQNIVDIGLRVAEVAGLQTEDIDLGTGGVRVLGKGRKIRRRESRAML